MIATTEEMMPLPDGPTLAVRRRAGSERPFLLVHGLASNSRMWDGVADRLAAAGHEVLAVDLRGHGLSEQASGGYTTQAAAGDLAALIALLGWTGGRRPIVAGQSWGGNVVLDLAARYGGVAAVALVDGGWIRLRERFTTFDECWAVLAPPSFDATPWTQVVKGISGMVAGWPQGAAEAILVNLRELPDGTTAARLTRAHHREIVHSLWSGDPRPLYPRVAVPAMLMAAVSAPESPESPGSPEAAGKRAAVAEAAGLLPDAEVRWYVGAHHDLHLQHPDRCAADLLTLAARA